MVQYKGQPAAFDARGIGADLPRSPKFTTAFSIVGMQELPDKRSVTAPLTAMMNVKTVKEHRLKLPDVLRKSKWK